MGSRVGFLSVFAIHLHGIVFALDDAMIPDRTTRMTVARLKQRMDSRFNAVDRRFSAVDRRFDAVDRRFDAVDRRFDSIEKKLDVILATVKAQYEHHSRILDEHHDRISDLESRRR
jgi:ribosomal protein L44E